ncbi:MAG: hypothetical protein V4465_02530 [Patescibacteria group bacterium]
MTAHSTAVNFVLDATNDEQRAIKVVRLLYSLVSLDMADQNDNLRSLRVRDTHVHFPVFAEALGLGHSSLYSYDEGNEECPAVTLYERAFSEHPESKNLAWSFLHQGEFDRQEIMRNCLKEAAGIAVGFCESDLNSAIAAFYTAVKNKTVPATT